MRILAIDTVTEACSVALFEDDELLARNYAEIGRGHAEKLIPMVEQLPKNGRADHILVNRGPGSFTGIRIGISATTALAFAWRASASSYQSLQLVAKMVQSTRSSESAVFVAMIGGHGEYFVQNFNGRCQPLDACRSLGMDEAVAYAKSALWAGNGIAQLATPSCGNIMPSTLPDAAQAMKLPYCARSGPLAPSYGRPPDASPKAA